MRKGKELV